MSEQKKSKVVWDGFPVDEDGEKLRKKARVVQRELESGGISTWVELLNVDAMGSDKWDDLTSDNHWFATIVEIALADNVKALELANALVEQTNTKNQTIYEIRRVGGGMRDLWIFDHEPTFAHLARVARASGQLQDGDNLTGNILNELQIVDAKSVPTHIIRRMA